MIDLAEPVEYPYPKGWLRAWLRRVRSLRAWGGPLAVEFQVEPVERAPLKLVRGATSRDEIDTVASCGQAWTVGYRQGRIEVYAGVDPSCALSVLLHEVAHVATGPLSGHGRAWQRLYSDAVRELTGRKVRGWLDLGFVRSDRLTQRATRAIAAWFVERGGAP